MWAASTVALLTTVASVAATGTAHAATCQASMRYAYTANGVFGLAGVKTFVSCTIAVPSITVTARLYRYDPVAGNVLIATSTNTGANTTYTETTASAPCVPGGYWGDGNYTVVWPGGSTWSGTMEMPQTAIYSCVV